MESASFVLPTGILQQDFDIIDEQENHVVLTVRVPINLIRDNHAQLMALSRIATGDPRPPAEPDPPAPSKCRAHQTYAALIFLGLALPSPFFAYSLAGYGPPVEYESVKMAKPAFEVGEDIDIVFHYRRDRFCLTSFDRTVGRDGSPIFSQRFYGIASTVTHGEFRDYHLMIHPMPPLKPGEYFYSGLTHSDCEKGGAYDLQHPRLGFTVVDHDNPH